MPYTSIDPSQNYLMRAKPLSDIQEVFQSLSVSIASFYCDVSVLRNSRGDENATTHAGKYTKQTAARKWNPTQGQVFIALFRFCTILVVMEMQLMPQSNRKQK